MHIILYVLDALRADHVGAYGYQRNITPNIDAIARDGIVFENCFTATTWTRPVAASILTGVYPAVHQTRSRAETFATRLVRLPELLQKAGFRTAGFSTMGNIAGKLGFGRGFDQYFDLFRDPEILQKRQALDKVAAALMHAEDAEMALPLAEDINSALFGWLTPNLRAHTFSFAWSIEPHVPYDAPEAFRRFSPARKSKADEGQQTDIRSAGAADRQRLINLYDDEIAYNDHCIGQIVDFLRTQGIYDETMLVIIGDHGEAFYEHGVYSHGHAPYDEVIHVPLIVKLPANAHAGQRVAELAALVDLLPTIVSAAGLELDLLAPDNKVQGINLLPVVRGEQAAARPYVYSDTQALEIHNRYLSIRSDRWKYMRVHKPPRDRSTLLKTAQQIVERRLIWRIIRSPRHFFRNYFRSENEFLFDIQADPAEQHNVIGQHPDVARQLAAQLATWMAENETLAAQVGAGEAIEFEENEFLRQHLEKLGYL